MRRKFNEFEEKLIIDALDYYVAHLEDEVEQMQTKDRRSIIAPGFYTFQKIDLISLVKSMTKKANI
jgi:hypothetical protein|tara:strand:+ start:1711 stop:1908 length:198 start_codon:yes stop_codon:yes gene_type:complete